MIHVAIGSFFVFPDIFSTRYSGSVYYFLSHDILSFVK